jgi:hypothetical protein
MRGLQQAAASIAATAAALVDESHRYLGNSTDASHRRISDYETCGC